MEKIIVVGAGLSGATIARLLAENGRDVTVLDKRATLGGNAYDYTDKNGIRIQPYGPHIFHTEDKDVFDFLSRFTEWRKYEHKVLANVKGRLVPVPFNLRSLELCFAKDKAERIKKVLTEEIGEGKSESILALKKHENPEIRAFAEYVYKNIYFKYTKKQWGMRPEEIGGSVINRVPVCVSDKCGYFTDEYQFMPKEGFSEMVNNILRHPRIKLKLKTDANKLIALSDGVVYYKGKEFDGTVIFTGRVEELFGYRFGALPYRTLKFKTKTYNKPSVQRAAVVNFTASHRYTRVSEFTKFTCDKCEKSVIVKEFPKKCRKGSGKPYYPVPTPENLEKYKKYEEEAAKYKNLKLLGRLAKYEYINMDVAVKKAIELFDEMD